MGIRRIDQDAYCVTPPDEDFLVNLPVPCVEDRGTICPGGGFLVSCEPGSEALLSQPQMPRGYVVSGTELPGDTWIACIPFSQEGAARSRHCSPVGRGCPRGNRYRCSREVLTTMGYAVPASSGNPRQMVQRAEREAAVAEAPAVVRPVARLGAGIMAAAEAVASPRQQEIVDPWSGAGQTPGVVDPWAQQPAAAVAKGMMDLGDPGGPVLFASKSGEVFGAQGKVGEVQKTSAGELVKTPQGDLVPGAGVPPDAQVVEASTFPVGPWFYAGVGGVALSAVGLGLYFLLRGDS
jgi:hypothetical protein